MDSHSKQILEQAKKVLEIESRAIARLIPLLNDDFVKAVDLIQNRKGRVVVTGIGKSGIIGKKISSTLSSVGTPSFSLHPVDGLHGDLGMITRDDIILAISHSGETEEMLNLIPVIKRFQVSLIVMTGNSKSTLARKADAVLHLDVEEEAGPWDLVPTASTTVAMAMGDALAMALLELKGFKKEDFAVLHPGGSIGKSLLLQVGEIMHTGTDVPVVKDTSVLKDVIYEMSTKRLGMTAVVNGTGAAIGVITDGDLRRMLEKKQDIFTVTAKEVMTKSPKTISKDSLAAEAVQIMEQHSITSLMVLNPDETPCGVIHLHDLLRSGIV